MTGQTSKVLAQVWTFPGSWRMSACQGVNYGGSFGIFLICPRLVEVSKTGIHQDQVVGRKAGQLNHQKLLCFPHHDGRNRIKIQPCGSAKHQCVDKPGWEGFQGCVGKQDDG